MSVPSLPPRQQLVAAGKWPVVGERRPLDLSAPWQITIAGLVERPTTWTLAELLDRPQIEQTIDIHCVTRWSKPGARFGGVPLASLLEEARPLPAARFVSFIARSSRRHSTSLVLEEALALGTLVALDFEGAPLSIDHGGPVRTIVPGRYFYKSLKWLERIELLAEDRLGYWESEAGYHNHADPWLEERYLASGLDRQEARRLIAARDVSGQNLLGLAAAGLDLAGLRAIGAVLRNADFRGANLAGACFDRANLSNGHLEGANLQRASFHEADVEGASFLGGDLRGADFTGASLFGASFCPEPEEPSAFAAARIDRSTRIALEALESLTPWQQAFVRARVG